MDWTARVSRVTKVGTRISLEMFEAEIYDAETEAEVLEILAEEYEAADGYSFDKIRSTPEQPE